MFEGYEPEILDKEDDDGTMPGNVAALSSALVGHRIISAEQREVMTDWRTEEGLVLILDNGHQVVLQDSEDCCAFTYLRNFWADPSAVDHVIMGVGTTNGYETWHIYADFGDVLELNVDWSPGNPFYYGYGFDISVLEISKEQIDYELGYLSDDEREKISDLLHEQM